MNLAKLYMKHFPESRPVDLHFFMVDWGFGIYIPHYIDSVRELEEKKMAERRILAEEWIYKNSKILNKDNMDNFRENDKEFLGFAGFERDKNFSILPDEAEGLTKEAFEASKPDMSELNGPPLIFGTSSEVNRGAKWYNEMWDKVHEEKSCTNFDWEGFNKEQNRKARAKIEKEKEGILKKMALASDEFDWEAFNKEQNRKMKANTGKEEEGILKKMVLTTEERFMIKDPTPSSHFLNKTMIPKRTIIGSVLYFISAVYARLMKRR